MLQTCFVPKILIQLSFSEKKHDDNFPYPYLCHDNHNLLILFPHFVRLAHFGNHEFPNSWIGDLGNYENVEHV